MKIYQVETLSECASKREVEWFKATYPTCYAYAIKDSFGKFTGDYRVTMRGEFIREHHIDGKTLARLLPAWAKPKKLPSMGAKVTAFYAENNKVICDRSALVVGSDEWHELQETLPDPFRATRRYMAEKYGRAYA